VLAHLHELSEIMFHPPDGSAFEFIELVNISPSETIDLTGVSFAAGMLPGTPTMATVSCSRLQSTSRQAARKFSSAAGTRMSQGRPRFLPCTPHGVQQLLHRHGITTSGMEADDQRPRRARTPDRGR